MKTDTTSTRQVYWNIVRTSTQLVQASSMTHASDTNANRHAIGNFLNWLDSPSTTSATTYKTQFYVSAGSSDVYAQFNSTASTITLMEIGA